MFALLPRFVALATELDDLCRHTLASTLLALGLNVEGTERNWKITLNGEVASSKKSTRVGFTNLLARPGFSDSLKRKLIDMLGDTQAHRDLQLEVENHAMAITQGVELLMQKIVRDGTPTNHLNDEVVQDVEQLEQRIHALGETLRCFSTAGCYDSEECTRIATASANSGNVLVSPHVEATKGEKHAMTTREELNKVSGIWVPSIRVSVRQIEQMFKASTPKRKSPKTLSVRTTKRSKMAVLPCMLAQEPCKPGGVSSAPELSLHEAVPDIKIPAAPESKGGEDMTWREDLSKDLWVSDSVGCDVEELLDDDVLGLWSDSDDDVLGLWSDSVDTSVLDVDDKELGE